MANRPARRLLEERYGKPLPQLLQQLAPRYPNAAALARHLDVAPGTVRLWLRKYFSQGRPDGPWFGLRNQPTIAFRPTREQAAWLRLEAEQAGTTISALISQAVQMLMNHRKSAPHRVSGIHKATRLLRIVELLTNEALGTADLARELGVTRRTIERDLKALRELPLGYPLTEDANHFWQLHN